MAPYNSAKEAIDSLGKDLNEKTLAGTISYLTTQLNKYEDAKEFNEELSKQLLVKISLVFVWFDAKDPVSQSQKEELARCIRLLALIPKAFPHFPNTFNQESFFLSKYEKYTSTTERSSIKFALVGLYAKMRSLHPPNDGGGSGGTSKAESPVWAWLQKQLEENKANPKLGLAYRLMDTSQDLLAMGDSPAVQNAECAMDCLATMRFLGDDMYIHLGMLLSDFAFFPFASKVLRVVVDQQPGLYPKMAEHFDALYMVWRRLRILDAKQREQEEEFAQRLNPTLNTTASVEELRFVTNWCHNSRHSARVLMGRNYHVLALEIVKNSSNTTSALVEASLALLVNLARKQVIFHQLLVDAGVGPVLNKVLENNKNPVWVHQALAVVLNMTSSNIGRATFKDLPKRIVFSIMPAYQGGANTIVTADGKLVLEMALGALWGLVVRFTTDEQVNGTFLDQWLGQVFNAVVNNSKEVGIVHRGLGALIIMFSLNKDSQKLITKLQAIFPTYPQKLKAVQNNQEKTSLVVSDIDLFVQLAGSSSPTTMASH
ncbi:hypothetical protein BASA81_003414 [Batrachochytrium salamandrivorans]|nr:hypothetical protein BASA81_003414 [Batrachochytrium salamandrivorans]